MTFGCKNYRCYAGKSWNGAHEDEKARTFTYTEAEMVLHASVCASEREAHKRKNPYTKSHGKPVGAAWRTPQT